MNVSVVITYKTLDYYYVTNKIYIYQIREYVNPFIM